MSGPGLAVGAAVRELVIEPGLPGTGLRLWSEPFLAQESPTEVRVVVAASGGQIVVLIGVDTSVIPDELGARARALAAAAAGTDAGHVLINASHAHSTPPLPGWELSDPTAELAGVERLGERFVAAVERATSDAVDAMRPARMGAGWGSSPIGVYRREIDQQGRPHLGEVPDRPIDRSVGVIRFDDLAGAPIAVVFSFSCHPVLHGPLARAVSSDYPGTARVVVERNLVPATDDPPPVAVFLQACGGDTNPRYGIGAEEDPNETKDREGTVLGAEVARVAAEIRTNAYRGPRTKLHGLEISAWPWLPVEGHASPRIAAVFRTIPLPLTELPPMDVAQRISGEHDATLRRLESAGARPTELRIARRWAEWADRLVTAVETGGSTIEVPIQAIRIGDVAVVGIGMEVFSDTGVEVRRASPFADTHVLGYSNGSHGYLPRAQDLPPGGWSPLERYALPDLYPQAWLQPTAIGPAAEQIVVQASSELLAEIA